MTGSTPAGSTPVETGPAAPATAAAQPEAVQTEPCAALPEGRVQGREAFRQAVRDALACAAEQGWPELIVSDPDYSDWPLGEAGVVASLYRWARPGRQFTMLAGSYGAIERLHPRFVPWRRDMAHLINCRIITTVEPINIPSACWSPQWVLQRVEPARSTLLCSKDANRGAALRELLHGWLARSTTGFPVTTLGL